MNSGVSSHAHLRMMMGTTFTSGFSFSRSMARLVSMSQTIVGGHEISADEDGDVIWGFQFAFDFADPFIAENELATISGADAAVALEGTAIVLQLLEVMGICFRTGNKNIVHFELVFEMWVEKIQIEVNTVI